MDSQYLFFILLGLIVLTVVFYSMYETEDEVVEKLEEEDEVEEDEEETEVEEEGFMAKLTGEYMMYTVGAVVCLCLVCSSISALFMMGGGSSSSSGAVVSAGGAAGAQVRRGPRHPHRGRTAPRPPL